jgi:hypothetical protein
MNNGEYTFYTFQQRTVAKSLWSDPNGPLFPTGSQVWAGLSWDYFGNAINPLVRTRYNDYIYPYHGGKEPHDVWSKTGAHGYWTRAFAVEALKRLRAADLKGEFDSRDTYRKLNQAVRHEFRLVEITKSCRTTPLSE